MFQDASQSNFYEFLEHFGTHFIKPDGESQKVRSLSSEFLIFEERCNYTNGKLITEFEILNFSDSKSFTQEKPASDCMEKCVNFYLHQHDYFELMYVLEGIVPVQIENELYQYQINDICLINRSVKHIECIDSNCTLIFICLPVELANEVYSKLVPGMHDALLQFFGESLSAQAPYKKNFLELRRDRSHSIMHLSPRSTLCQMLEELRGQHAGYISIVQGLLFRFFYYLTEDYNYVPSFVHLVFSLSDYIFEQINTYMIRVNGQIVRKDLETELHYNADYLNKIVKKHSGMTLTEYGQSYRMKQAARLICTTTDPISKIIQDLGFDSKAYFYRLFEKYYHMSPVLYRKYRNKQGDSDIEICTDN